MASSLMARTGVTLEQFLQMPDIEAAPGLEYLDGRIEAKAMPNPDHVLIAKRFVRRLDEFSETDGLGVTFFELRHTFDGRSILPDVSFQLAENVVVESDGRLARENRSAPDIHIEVISPDQAVQKIHAKLLHSTANGCALGVMVHPEKKTIDVYRPGRSPERLTDDGAIDFAPVLPGLVVAVAEVFSWMVVRLRRPGADPA
ncbi:MAG: hypothetical protein JWN86_2574 [Planctomycetota bacterium]|nr:hypothetical protein [Planctomycetota bacterium]